MSNKIEFWPEYGIGIYQGSVKIGEFKFDTEKDMLEMLAKLNALHEEEK